MKKSIYFTILCGTLLLCCSCDGFLDRKPLDQISADNFYKTESDADLATLSIYSVMMDVEWMGKNWMITEIPSDNSQAGGTDPDFTPIDNFSVSADNPVVANYWAFHYRQVTLANVVIERVTAMEQLEAAKKDLFIAEARFLRALAYFDLVRIYGGVPLIEQAPAIGQDLLYPRANVNEVYDFIIADLEFAGEVLPADPSANIGRATKGAALALLSKVHLTLRNHVAARDNAKAVIDLNVYSLMPNFADNFELSTTDNNAEAIFQVQYAGCGPFNTGNAMQAFFAPWGEGITKDRDGWGSQIPTGPITNNPRTTIIEAYEDGDTRKHATVMTPNDYYPTINPSDGGYTYPANGASASISNIKKYVVGSGPNICFMSTPQNAHVIRYSDVLLTYAEAIMKIEGGVSVNEEALEAFNEVRLRAGAAPLDQIDEDILLKERRLEFAFEGHRWFDLLRSGKTIEIMTLHGKNISVDNLLFPIPNSELEINTNLTQNPGY